MLNRFRNLASAMKKCSRTVAIGGLLLVSSSSAHACWYCGEVGIWTGTLTSVESLYNELTSPMYSSDDINTSLQDIKSELKVVNKSFGDIAKVRAAKQDMQSKVQAANSASADNVESLAENKPSLEGCVNATNQLSAGKSHLGGVSALNTYLASGESALVRQVAPEYVRIQHRIAAQKNFCTAEQAQAEAGAHIPIKNRQCPPTPPPGAIPAAAISSASVSGGVSGQAPPGGGAPDTPYKVNDSIGSTAKSSAVSAGVDAATAANQPSAASLFMVNMQGPDVPQMYDQQAIDTPAGKAYATYWDAFSARMSTVVSTLASIASVRTAPLDANGEPLPVDEGDAWHANRQRWEGLFPGGSFPDNPSEWERIKYDIYRRVSDTSIDGWAFSLPAPERELDELKALQMEIDFIKIQRQEENNKLRAAYLAQVLNPVDRQDMKNMSLGVAATGVAMPR